jgi:hypothetical protein
LATVPETGAEGATATLAYTSDNTAPDTADDLQTPEERVRIAALAVAIVKSLIAGDGRTGLCDSEAELITRLDQDGILYDPADIPAALALAEAGEVSGQSYKV